MSQGFMTNVHPLLAQHVPTPLSGTVHLCQHLSQEVLAQILCQHLSGCANTHAWGVRGGQPPAHMCHRRFFCSVRIKNKILSI